ncbi:phage tail protein [Lacticaseibacillus pantheris]|uniref:phage tail protein n=1 Tax=Lacticaseibacillus pantheris TaxID=171523 RepID=UPI0006D21357
MSPWQASNRTPLTFSGKKNSTWQLEFTAIADGSVAYSMLDTLSSVYFAGQQYVISQVVPDFSQGLASVQVTATHIYTQVSRVRQYNTRTGTMTYQQGRPSVLFGRKFAGLYV